MEIAISNLRLRRNVVLSASLDVKEDIVGICLVKWAQSVPEWGVLNVVHETEEDCVS